MPTQVPKTVSSHSRRPSCSRYRHPRHRIGLWLCVWRSHDPCLERESNNPRNGLKDKGLTTCLTAKPHEIYSSFRPSSLGSSHYPASLHPRSGLRLHSPSPGLTAIIIRLSRTYRGPFVPKPPNHRKITAAGSILQSRQATKQDKDA